MSSSPGIATPGLVLIYYTTLHHVERRSNQLRNPSAHFTHLKNALIDQFMILDISKKSGHLTLYRELFRLPGRPILVNPLILRIQKEIW